MKQQASREVWFAEERVQEWCIQHDDPNPIHIDGDEAADSSFGQAVVPGMMILSELSGLLTSLGEEDEEIILAGVTAARFRDPVLLGETVTLSVDHVNDQNNFTAIDFEARVEARDSLVANGALSIVVK